MQPYIGITGIAREEEARLLALLAPRRDRPVMVGYALTPSSLVDRPISPRYVSLELLPELLSLTRSHYNVIHYSSRAEESLAALTRILSFDDIYEQGLCRGLQLNTRMTSCELFTLKDRFPALEVIFPLPIPERERWWSVIEEVALHPVDAFLIDPSGGRGLPFPLEVSARLYCDLRAVTGLPGGFAGGFTPNNVHKRVTALRTLVGDDFSIDIETGVRTNDLLDARKVTEYALGARRGFS